MPLPKAPLGQSCAGVQDPAPEHPKTTQFFVPQDSSGIVVEFVKNSINGIFNEI
jgi:hypothetical protein